MWRYTAEGTCRVSRQLYTAVGNFISQRVKAMLPSRNRATMRACGQQDVNIGAAGAYPWRAADLGVGLTAVLARRLDICTSLI